MIQVLANIGIFLDANLPAARVAEQGLILCHQQHRDLYLMAAK